MLIPFALAIFLGASLLFLIQPLAAKLILPSLGGSPAVWNTCLVFYQTLLLGGYAYAHAIAGLKPKTQLLIHGPVLLASLLFLPIALPQTWSAPEGELPIWWLVSLLAVMVGAPYFAVSSASPLLQSWFSRTRHRRSDDPYFLYAASNAGSLLGLLSYPFLLEPSLTLAWQGRVWAIGYGAFVVVMIGCGLLMVRRPTDAPAGEPAPAERVLEKLTIGRQARWVLLAAIPSSLMLGVTHHITMDIAAIPFLWILPLSIYLLTFILSFSSLLMPPIWLSDWMFRLAAIAALGIPAVAAVLTRMGNISAAEPFTQLPLLLILILHIAVLLFAAMACHQRLAHNRPSAGHLTRFYLLLSLGGAMGGAFNALVSPALFSWIVEYPLVILVGCFVTLAGVREGAAAWKRGLVRYGAVALSLVFAVVAGLHVWKQFDEAVIHRERTFFGVHRVEQVRDTDGNLMPIHQLMHGTTKHGIQWMEGPFTHAPTMVYAPPTGIGRFMRANKGQPVLEDVAVVGLGIGTLTVYAEAGQNYTYFEIDPAVQRIAENTDYFTHLDGMKGEYDVILGDARLSMADVPDDSFSLIILDAFSSDAIPVHLLTVEAFEMYRTKLVEGGVIAVHVSNRHLELVSPVAATAEAAGLMAWEFKGFDGRPPLHVIRERNPLWMPGATWMILGESDNAIRAMLIQGDQMKRVTDLPEHHVWTDDYSNLFRALR